MASSKSEAEPSPARPHPPLHLPPTPGEGGLLFLRWRKFLEAPGVGSEVGRGNAPAAQEVPWQVRSSVMRRSGRHRIGARRDRAPMEGGRLPMRELAPRASDRNVIPFLQRRPRDMEGGDEHEKKQSRSGVDRTHFRRTCVPEPGTGHRSPSVRPRRRLSLGRRAVVLLQHLPGGRPGRPSSVTHLDPGE